VGPILIAILKKIDSSHWSIRNAALAAFSRLMDRVIGKRRTKEVHLGFLIPFDAVE